MKHRQSQLIFKWLFFFSGLLLHTIGTSQDQESIRENVVEYSNVNFQFGLNIGVDKPAYTNNFIYYKVTPGLKFGTTIDYNFGTLGLGLDYDFIRNGASSSLNETFYADSTFTIPVSKTDVSQQITRHFIGIGPNFNYGLGYKIKLKAYLRGGYSMLKGGELVTTAPNQGATALDHHVLFAGIDGTSLAAKGGLNIDFKVSQQLGLSIGAYYMNHFSVHTDTHFELDNQGNIGLVYGHSPFTQLNDEDVLGIGSAYTVSTQVDEDPLCASFTSIGVTLGAHYVFGMNQKAESACSNCSCPDDGHKVIVTVRDELSSKVIPNADVAIKDVDGNIAASGTTNNFGVVDFGEIPHGNYYIDGLVYGIETTKVDLVEDDFQPNAIIRKEVLYTDLRFILNGKVVNKNTRTAESNVVVNLTNKTSHNVEQGTSDGQGKFIFRLDKNSSYEIVGVKENRLSDIARASTVGLKRSTTLFVDLELGVENFDCGRGTVLDIKYEYDKDVLLPESKFELDKLVRYMQAHNVSKVELSSHTDSRGTHEYNQDLSQRRAQSAVSYISSKGIALSRIFALGFGETRPLNQCRDGVKCSEEEHRINRRTEAKLLCN